MRKLNILDWTTFILLIIGGLNWGLVGGFNINVVENLSGAAPVVSKIVYIVVGLAALYGIVILQKLGKR